MKFFFTKLNFHTCVPPLIRLLKKIFTKLNFLSRDSGMNFLIFFALRSGPLVSFGVIFLFFRCGRCVRGFWRQMPVYTLLLFQFDFFEQASQ